MNLESRKIPNLLKSIGRAYARITFKQLCAGLGAFAAIVLFVGIYFSIAPSNFPSRKIVTIDKGMYMSQAADTLSQSGVIRSPLLFKLAVVLLSGHRQVQAGDYLFDSPQSVLRVAYRAIHGDQGLPSIKVTIFEGLNAKEIGALIKKSIPAFDAVTFATIAKPYEGYLFPDTYFFHETIKPADVLSTLRDTFNQKLVTIAPDIARFGKSQSDVITMASIVEREAMNSIDRRIIAGILWKRISINMPLQVDPPFYYILGKNSEQLTVTDLATTSAFNLYKHTGLPPTPIDNPGLTAIVDTITPTPTKYLFYLSDRNGVMHYAETFDGHIANRAK